MFNNFFKNIRNYFFISDKITFLLFGGLGNQIIMASIALIYAKENNIKNLDFQYVKPTNGASRESSLKNYKFANYYKINQSNRFIQKVYKILTKFKIFKKDFIIWEGMQISILLLPFKKQIEINQLELKILSDKKYLKQFFKNFSLLNNKKNSFKISNIIIHFRDYEKELNCSGKIYQLKESYFINAVNLLEIPSGTNITVMCFEEPINKFSILSKKYKLNYITNKMCNPLQALEIMRNANVLIMSNSTLSWLGAYASKADALKRKVVFPQKFSKGLINWKPSYLLSNWIPCYE